MTLLAAEGVVAPNQPSSRLDDGRGRIGIVMLHAVAPAASHFVSAAAFASNVRCRAACALSAHADAQLHRSLRFLGVLATSLVRLKALSDARAMDRLR